MYCGWSEANIKTTSTILSTLPSSINESKVAREAFWLSYLVIDSICKIAIWIRRWSLYVRICSLDVSLPCYHYWLLQVAPPHSHLTLRDCEICKTVAILIVTYTLHFAWCHPWLRMTQLLSQHLLFPTPCSLTIVLSSLSFDYCT